MIINLDKFISDHTIVWSGVQDKHFQLISVHLED